MSTIAHRNNEMFCEGVPLAKIAAQVGTPCYVYSHTALTRQFDLFSQGFADIDHLVCYSMKANSNGAILRTLVQRGSGIDVVTGGELTRALQAGCPATRIVFSGVGKSGTELDQALDAGILQFNVESREELVALNERAIAKKLKAPVAIRVNPDVDPKTHTYISTGLKKNKFGIGIAETKQLYREIKTWAGIEIVGIDCHIGSQLTTVAPFVEAMQRVKRLIEDLQAEGIRIKHWDIGGGLGVIYDDETPPSPEDYAVAVRQALGTSRLKLVLEPGRFLVANAGCLVTKVLYNKQGEAKHFVIVDAASNDLMRPALYDAFHKIHPVLIDPAREKIVTDVVGPICETGDFLARDRKLPKLNQGELMVIMSAGAYGFSMASQYNSRPRVAEVLVKGSEFFIIRERETLADIVRQERVPGFLS